MKIKHCAFIVLAFISLIALEISPRVEAIAVEDETAEEEKAQKAAQLKVTQERIERMVAKLSVTCQAELQAAYTEEAELSDSCKLEIKERLQQDLAQFQDASGAMAERSKSETGEEENKDKDDPTPYVIGFLVILFSAAGIYVYSVNQQIRQTGRPVKKLSKKKEAKRRMKEQRILGK